MGESIAEFMERQRRKVARYGREAEALAHEAYGKAIRAGENLRLSSPGDVMRYGAKILEKEAAPSSREQKPGVTPAKPTGQPRSARAVGGPHEALLQADAAMRGAANVLTFGGADYLAARLDALGQPGGLSGWRQRYEANLGQERARNRYDKAHRPVAQASGQVGGALIGVGLVGPIEGALAAAPRLSGAATLSGREGAAILGSGGAAGLGIQTLTDGVAGHRSTVGDNVGAVVGGVAGAAALPFGPARAGAIGASTTSVSQDLFNGRPIAIDRAGESAIAGNLLGGIAGMAGRGWANGLPQQAKGPLGEAVGEVRSTLNGQRRIRAPKARDEIYEGQVRPYWYPDARSGRVRFEDKFGVKATLSPNQILAQQALGDDFVLYHSLPADFGKAAAVPATAVVPHIVPSRRRR